MIPAPVHREEGKANGLDVMPPVPHYELESERECNCLVPYFEGAGQHAPGCSIFAPEEREANREEIRRMHARLPWTAPVHREEGKR